MSAPFRVLKDVFKAFDLNGPGRLGDPGDGGTINVVMWGQVCSVTTTGASETRILGAPTKPGILCAVAHDTDGGDFTLTVNPTSGTCYGYNQDNDYEIAFADAGDYVAFYSIKIGSEYAWRAVAQEGTNVALETAEFDALITSAITGGDNSLGITGQTQATTVAGGAVVVAGAASIAGATGAGGAATLVGGASGSTNGAGGAAAVQGGAGTGTGAGGIAYISGGTAGATGTGGATTVKGGNSAAGATGDGGPITVSGGASASTNGAGGAAGLWSGSGTGTGASGIVTVSSGSPATSSGAASGAVTVGSSNGAYHATAGGAGGTVAVTGGAGGLATSGTGGAGASVDITGGVGGADSGSGQGGAGGTISLTPGDGGASVGGTAGIAGNIYLRGKTLGWQATPATATNTVSLTDAQILSGILVATPTAAAAYTVRTGTQIEAALGGTLTINDSFDLTIINLGATTDTITLTVAAVAGITALIGDPCVYAIADIATLGSSSGTFRFVRTALNTFSIYRVT